MTSKICIKYCTEGIPLGKINKIKTETPSKGSNTEGSFPIHTLLCPLHRIHVPVHRIHVPVHRVNVPIHKVHIPVHSVYVPVHRVHVPVHRVHIPVHRVYVPVHSGGYDSTGNRVIPEGKAVYYVRDAQGNVMAVYAQEKNKDITAESFYIYGSSRVGELDTSINMRTATVSTFSFSRIRGIKRYEMSNHLGNVMVVVSDRKVYDGNVFKADLVSSTDYYAFGMVMSDRSWNTEGYRFGFNGKENDNEVKGTGNQQDYGMRIYDPRLGRFYSVDPLTKAYPWYTPYQFAGNTPIEAIDLDGLEPYKKAYKFADNSNPLLNLFHADNIINMNDVRSPASFNSLGIPRDAQYFWEKYKNTPLGKQALSNANLDLIESGKAPLVDKQWNSVMKQFGADGIESEIIHHHHLNKGPSTIPLPFSKHISKAFNSLNHAMNKRVGSVNQKIGQVLSRAGRYTKTSVPIFVNFLPILTNSPNSPVYMFQNPGSGEENRAYPTNLYLENSPSYYEWRWTGKPGESLREVIYFNDYKRINGEWRGVDPTGQKEYFNKDGKKTATAL